MSYLSLTQIVTVEPLSVALTALHKPVHLLQKLILRAHTVNISMKHCNMSASANDKLYAS